MVRSKDMIGNLGRGIIVGRLAAAVVIPWGNPEPQPTPELDPDLSAYIECPAQPGDSISLHINFFTPVSVGDTVAIGVRNESEDTKGIVKGRKIKPEDKIQNSRLIGTFESPIIGDPDTMTLNNGDKLIIRGYVNKPEQDTDAVKRQDLIINCPQK